MNRSRFDPRPATNSHYAGRVHVFAAAWAPVLACLAAPLFTALAGRPVERLLDLGCGVGTALCHLPPADLCVGVDHFRDMLVTAQSEQPGLRPVLADAVRLPFRDRAFDVVFAGFMLHHVREQWRALGEVYRVLRPRGWLGVATWGPADPGSAAFEVFEAALRAEGAPDADPAAPPVWSERLATPADLEALTRPLGFQTVRIWSDTPTWTWDPASLLAYRAGLGGSGRRFDRLSEAGRARCLSRAAAGLARLSTADLTWKPEIILALVERGASREEDCEPQE